MNMRKNQATRIATYHRLLTLVAMTEKYKCTVYKNNNNRLEEIAKNEKPKNVVEIINQYGS